MSCRPCDSEKLKKKSKKAKVSTRKTQQKSSSQLKDASTKCSKDVEPPSIIVESVNSGGLKWDQEKPRERDPYEDGNYSKMPYEAPNEVNFIGGIGTNKGHRRSKKFINRTTKIQQIYNMRNDNKPIFDYIEDPRLNNNVPSRGKVYSGKEDKKFVKEMISKIGAIKHEQIRIIDKSASTTDFSKTSESKSTSNNYKDGSLEINKAINVKIRKQYLAQKRKLLKQHLESQIPKDLEFEHRKEKFKISQYFDADKNIPDEQDIESVREVNVEWSDVYKVEKHKCDLKFGRPMPEVIPLPLEREKLAFLTRTLDKPKNIDKLNEEVRKCSKTVVENIINDFPHRETVRELEKILNKQRVENRSIEMALNDFDEFIKTAGIFEFVESKEDDNGKSIDDRREKLNDAMRKYEEQILNQLPEPDETSSVNKLSDCLVETIRPSKSIQRFKETHLTRDVLSPIDFTYAFDTRQNKKSKELKYPVHSVEKEEVKDTTLIGSTAQLTNSKREKNISSIETLKEAAPDKNDNKKDDIMKNASFCTNFTDDSGSFILVQDKQLHFDNLKATKEVVRSKTITSVHNFNEYFRPYEVMPLVEAKKVGKRDSNLVPTCDIKERLKVDVPMFEAELIGVKDEKYVSQLATEWDEYYQKEIINRPRIRRFKPRTIMKQIVDSLRLKYESIYKHEYLTEKSIIIEQEKLFTKRAENFRDFCMEFFSNLTTTSYRQSMAKIQDLRPMYELNDELTSELTVLNNQLIQLKTDIIRTEGKAREKTILQNVSYLMKEPNWREKNDWIHKRQDGTLETIKESIEKRMTTNLRKRDNDDVWAIKEFFENNVFDNKRPALVCFESPDAILTTITNLKVQLYLSLLKLDLSTWTLMNLKHAYSTYCKWSSDFIDQRKKYVEARCAKKYFLEVCAANMKKDAVELINGKLVETISEKSLRTVEPLCNTLFQSVIPKNIQEQSEGSDAMTKFSLIIAHAMNMLEHLDAIPLSRRKEIEKKIRKENGFIQRRTKRAVDLETHIEKVRKVMIKHSTPPFKRPPRTGKLPKSQLPTPKPKSVTEITHPTEYVEMAPLTITEHDFAQFVQENPPQNDFYLDATFFGGDIDVPNIDFLPEMKSNINEFIIDVKNILQKWEQHKQGRYLEDAHLAWTAHFRQS